jgi:hypothetical protein
MQTRGTTQLYAGTSSHVGVHEIVRGAEIKERREDDAIDQDMELHGLTRTWLDAGEGM